MPEDKRPRPALDMNPDPANKLAPRLESPRGPAERGRSMAGPPGGESKAFRLGSFFSHMLAGLIGALFVAGAGFFAVTQDIPGISLSDPATRRQIQRLQDRTAEIDRTFRASSPSAGVGSQGSNETRARIDSIVNASKSIEEAMQSLSQRLASLEQESGAGLSKNIIQDEVRGQTAPLAQRVAAMEREFETMSRAQTERQYDSRTAALTLALTNLKRAVAEGRAFSVELAALESLSGTKLPVSQLAPFKDQGVLSLAELQRDFPDASAKAIQAYYRGKTDSIMGEVISRAKAAIQVKPAGGQGSAPEAILGRMDRALKSGNLREALTEGASLEGPAQEAMQTWLGKAQERTVADEVLRKTDQELLASLTKAVARRP